MKTSSLIEQPIVKYTKYDIFYWFITLHIVPLG